MIKKTKNKKLEMDIRDEIQEQYPDSQLLFMSEKEFDKAIVGVAEGKDIEPKVVYDFNKVIKANMKMGMTYEEAVEYFYYNQIGAYMGEHTPLFLNVVKM